MTSVFHEMTAAGSDLLKNFAGQSVEYRRGIASTVLTAVHSPRMVDSADANGLPVTLVADDFLIASADLVLDSEAVEPAEGDLIILEGLAARTYQVMPDASGRCFFYRDSAQRQMRVHTKLIEQTQENVS